MDVLVWCEKGATAEAMTARLVGRARPGDTAAHREGGPALHAQGRHPARPRGARDPALARQVLLGVALDAVGHRAQHVVRDRPRRAASRPRDARLRYPFPPMVRFYLESMVEGGRQLRRIALHPLPFRVGRQRGLSLFLASESVSKEHAEIVLDGDALCVRDLGSKNGTFVNSERVSEARLNEGDILHFAQVEFRVGRHELDEAEPGLEPSTVSLGDMRLPQQFVEGVRELPELLEGRMVTTLFQPIVSLPSGSVAGYEALGRGLPRPPAGAAAGSVPRGVRDRRRSGAEPAVPRVRAVERGRAARLSGVVREHPSLRARDTDARGRRARPARALPAAAAHARGPRGGARRPRERRPAAHAAEPRRHRHRLRRLRRRAGAAARAGRGAARLPEVRHAVRARHRQGRRRRGSGCSPRSSPSRATSSSTRSPRASRPRRRPRCACASASRTPRATTSAARVRSRRFDLCSFASVATSAVTAARQ